MFGCIFVCMRETEKKRERERDVNDLRRKQTETRTWEGLNSDILQLSAPKNLLSGSHVLRHRYFWSFPPVSTGCPQFSLLGFQSFAAGHPFSIDPEPTVYEVSLCLVWLQGYPTGFGPSVIFIFHGLVYIPQYKL